MLTESQLNTITEYVDDRYFDTGKLIKYLEVHNIVGNEVFSYCDKQTEQKDSATYASWLDDERGYRPLPVDAFIRRIPFYFYVSDCSDGRIGNLHFLISDTVRGCKDRNTLEELYQALEYMLYDKHLSLKDIFCYTVEQTHLVSRTNVFLQWNHYLHLCDKLGRPDYLPEIFITSYNEVLELSGLPPIIYEIGEIMLGDMSWRTGSKIEFEGTFPCDLHGQPIMKWIGLRVKNAKSITCSQEKSSRGRLFVEITPSTTIHALNCYNNDGDEDCWYQIYAGPLIMAFDYEVLKYNRKRLKYTQKEVADAVGATVRTYQKWESGETIPDGHYLLRLLNWLDIRDVQDVVQYTE